MGPLHIDVADHICKIIANPELSLQEGADPKHATLNAHVRWNWSNAVNAICYLSSSLPHLKTMFLALLEGVLVTWGRFSAESNEDGVIARLTGEEKKLNWTLTTNDANEGARGQ